MGHSYTKFYYHFAWSTKLREPALTPDVEARVYAYISSRCKTMGVFVYAVNGIEDHSHLVCSVPPTIAVSDFIEKVKGSSSHYINHLADFNRTLYWQPGYGGLTFGEKDLERVVRYVKNQKEHHKQDRLWSSLEKFGPDPNDHSPPATPPP